MRFFRLIPVIALLCATAFAATPVAPGVAALPRQVQDAFFEQLRTEMAKLLKDADAALKGGNLNLALIQLKNAVRLAPQDGNARAQLGMALLRSGDTVAAEQALRQARGDGASEDIVVPPILQVMLMRAEFKQLLAEFPEPPQPAAVKSAADIFRARAFALQTLGDPQKATGVAGPAGHVLVDVDPRVVLLSQKRLRLASSLRHLRYCADSARSSGPFATGNDDRSCARRGLYR